MRFFIGIDDTDHVNSPSTGDLAKEMGELLTSHHLATLEEITMHQLLTSPIIPVTRSNSAYCLTVEANEYNKRILESECRSILLHHSAAGANAGLAVLPADNIPDELRHWGKRAKEELLQRSTAMEMVKRLGLPAAGLTGSGAGMIGALAAIGLRASGEDGCFVWLAGLDDLTGVLTLGEILTRVSLGRVETARGRTPAFSDRVELIAPISPLLRGGRSLLLVEPSQDRVMADWRTLDQARIQQMID